MKIIKRPIVFFVIAWIIGLIGGALYVKDIQGWPFFCVLVGVTGLGFYYFFGKKGIRFFVIALLMGLCVFLMHPIIQGVGKLKENTTVTLEGIVKDIQVTDYGQNVILKKVTVKEEPSALKGNIQVQISLNERLSVGERLQIIGKVSVFPVLMNPSDFNYGLYLKGQNIVAVVKAKQCIHLGEDVNLLRGLENTLKNDIQAIFNGEDEGVMQAALLGDDTGLEDQIQSLYSAVGIGHILCVSGFHVALVISFLLSIGQWLGMPYNKRYLFIMSGIWAYALLTGMSASTVRASIMASLVMLARVIWEEEDFWTSLAISALVILVWRPYQLFSMGFQLSFVAVSAIGVSHLYLKKWKTHYKGWQQKMINVLMPWLCITFITSPIIAFHYYEIPFFSSVLNLLILPIFSVLIILGWCTLGMYIIGLPIIPWLIKGIITLLQGIRLLCEVAVKIPFGTICLGRPSWMDLLIYYSVLLLIGSLLYGMKLSQKLYNGSYIGLCIWLVIRMCVPHLFQVTYLYVGQGDGSVIETPHQQIILIDGGPPGKGKSIEKYVKYKGKKKIDAVMVSHSDSDHIGGVIELIEGDLKVERVIISKVDDSDLLREMEIACDKKKVPILRMGASDEFQVDGVKFEILAPKVKQSEMNNNSLVCLTSYREFKALFTGDKEKESEPNIYNKISPITVLKVSHHGSKTGTEEKLLLKLQPQYAMISCGINNRYGHPHKEVLEALQKCEVPYERTDLQGAIWIRTNGETMALYTQREEE